MDIYDKLYKTIEGHGIGDNILLIRLREFLDAPRLKGRIFNVNGYKLFEGEKDILKLLHHNIYEAETTEFIKEHAKGIGLDLGACIGYFSLLMAQKCKKVYAFEPSKKAFNLLIDNIVINHTRNIWAINKAVGSKNESGILHTNTTDIGSNSLIHQGNREGDQEQIKIVKLDDFFRGTPKPHLIKMDIEGNEKQAILGGKAVFKASSSMFVPVTYGTVIDATDMLLKRNPPSWPIWEYGSYTV